MMIDTVHTEKRHGVPLTPRQAEIFDYIVQRIQGGLPPAVREIGDKFNIRSPNGVCTHLKSLEKKGLIARDKHCSRSIRLTNDSPVAYAHRVGNDVWLMDGPTQSGATRIGTMHYERFVELTGVELNGKPKRIKVSAT